MVRRHCAALACRTPGAQKRLRRSAAGLKNQSSCCWVSFAMAAGQTPSESTHTQIKGLHLPASFQLKRNRRHQPRYGTSLASPMERGRRHLAISSWRVRSDTIALQELLPREPAEPREPLRSPFGTASFSSSTDQLNPARAVGAGAQSEPCPCLPSSRGRKPSSASKTTTGEMDAAGRKLKILCFACGCGGGETTQRIRRKPPLQNQSIFSDKEDRVAS
ncbi:hypothetical protein PAHAL_4G041700 [Panicum hallii]|uniref:Uncharacterized protein n=1 Tax=Panicum hallii TaxID=206008 RepID=A0A2T8JBP6_9POAL|nr:hypothetical protein PAHAL_4G041700 [Panicum hallii]